MGKVSLSRSVSILALTAGLLGSADGWGTTDYTRLAQDNGGAFTTTTNWDPGGTPGASDKIIFDQTSAGLDTTSVGSVDQIVFGDRIRAVTLTTTSGQTFGSSGNQTVSVGSIGVANNETDSDDIDLPGAHHTINFRSAVTHGNLGSENHPDHLHLNYTGTSSILTDNNSVNYYAHMDFGTSGADVTTISGGGSINIHGPITGSGKVAVESTPLTLSNPGNSYSLEIDINSGGGLTIPAGDSTSTSTIRMGNGTLTFSDSTSSASYYGNIVLTSPAANNTISIPHAGTSVTLQRPITDSGSGNGFTLSSGALILGGTTRSTYTGEAIIGGDSQSSAAAILEGPSTLFPFSGSLSPRWNGILQFTDAGAQEYEIYDGPISFGNGSPSLVHHGSGKLQLTGSITSGNNPKVTVDGGGTLRLSYSFTEGDGFSSGAYVRNGSTLELDSSASLGYTNGVHFDNGSGNNLVFYNSETDRFDYRIDTNSSYGMIVMAGSGRLTLGGEINGQIGIQVDSGTLVLEGPNKSNYNQPTTIQSGATLALSSIDNTSTGGSFTINGGTFDISNFADISIANQHYCLTNFTAGEGSTLTVAINDAQHSTRFYLDATSALDLSHLTLNINGATGTYTEDMEYTLFENAGNTTFSNSLHAINLNNVPGFTAALKHFNNGDTEVKFKLSKTPITPPATGGARNSASAHNSVQAVATNISSFAIGGTMVVARANAQDGPGGSGGDFGQPSPSFTRNPLKAPDLSKDFLSLTQGAMMKESTENAQRWSPARTEKTGVWVQPFGMTLRQTADKGAPGYNTRTGGLLAGFDHRVRYDVILGAGLGYAQTKLNFDSNQGKMSIKDKFLTFFGTWFRGPWYLEGSILMGLEKYQGSRNTGINNQFAINHHDGYQLTPKIGGGYTFDVKGYKVRAYTTFDYAYSTQYGYQETGSGATYWNKNEASMLRSEVGLNLTRLYECKDFTWKPGLTLGIVNKKPIKKGKIISPSAGSFESTTVTTTDIAPGVQSTWQFNDGYSLSASWTGEFGSKYTLQEATVKFTKKL